YNYFILIFLNSFQKICVKSVEEAGESQINHFYITLYTGRSIKFSTALIIKWRLLQYLSFSQLRDTLRTNPLACITVFMFSFHVNLGLPLFFFL
ncbi:hypothetical protein L9F63_016470, partial [Diploptera punctata]